MEPKTNVYCTLLYTLSEYSWEGFVKLVHINRIKMPPWSDKVIK